MNTMAEISPRISEFEIYEVGNFRLDSGISIGISLTLSILAYAAREAIASLSRRHAARNAEFEHERAERDRAECEKQRMIEYLKEQNKLLLHEILNLQRVVEMNHSAHYPSCPLPSKLPIDA